MGVIVYMKYRSNIFYEIHCFAEDEYKYTPLIELDNVYIKRVPNKYYIKVRTINKKDDRFVAKDFYKEFDKIINMLQLALLRKKLNNEI